MLLSVLLLCMMSSCLSIEWRLQCAQDIYDNGMSWCYFGGAPAFKAPVGMSAALKHGYR